MIRKYKAVYTCIPSPFYCPYRAREFRDGKCIDIWICNARPPNKCLRKEQFPDWCPLDDWDDDKEVPSL